MSEPSAESARVFFALWPAAEVRSALMRTAEELHEFHGGRRMRPDSLHLTLVFVGQVEASHLSALMAVAGSVQADHFETVFDQTDCWRHNRIACLGVTQITPALLELVKGLESRLEEAGIHFDRRPYKPHVTLLRNADCGKAFNPGESTKENPAPKPIRWPARDFVLVKSSLRPDGARYEELGRWPLL